MSTVSVDRTARRPYLIDGKSYFSVSTICRAMTGEDSYGSEDAMQRGTDLHVIFALAVAAYAGHCAPPAVPQEYQGYYHSMRWWIEQFKPEPVYYEHSAVCSLKGLPFAGTPDLLAWTADRGQRTLTLIDLKSGAKATWHRVQVQAYHRLDKYTEATAMRLLYIKEDGALPDYLPVKRSARDFAAFHAALSLLIYRETL